MKENTERDNGEELHDVTELQNSKVKVKFTLEQAMKTQRGE
jgi:hypothetical protein